MQILRVGEDHRERGRVNVPKQRATNYGCQSLKRSELTPKEVSCQHFPHPKINYLEER
jgi:hypothetical protein